MPGALPRHLMLRRLVSPIPGDPPVSTLKTLLRRLRARKSSPGAVNRKRLALGVESLETRVVPAIALVGTDLSVTAGDFDDAVSISVVRGSRFSASTITAERVETRFFHGEPVTTTESETFNLTDVARILVNLGNGTNSYLSSTFVPSVVFGGTGRDDIRGGTGADIFGGGLGDDELRGGGGNDTLVGGDGNDLIYGEAGNDSIAGNAGNDDIFGATGNDSISGGNGNDFLEGGSGHDTIRGGSSSDTVNGGSGNDELHGDSGSDRIDGLDGEDRAFGGTGNDTITGGNHDDELKGGTGNDSIFGGDGRDDLDGDEGNDGLYGDAGDDVITGGAADDFVDGAAGNDFILGSDGNDSLEGGPGNDEIWGGAGHDTLQGSAGDDELYALANTGAVVADGNNILRGGDGNDLLYGSRGNDHISGGVGNDRLYGNWGADLLFGDSGNDRLYGEDGTDQLFGGSGIDGLFGGHGLDFLTGGGGTDRLLQVEGEEDMILSLFTNDVVIRFENSEESVEQTWPDGDAVYGAAFWTDADVVAADGALGVLHEKMGSPVFLRLDGDDIAFRLVGSHLSGPGEGVLGWNDGSEMITLVSRSFNDNVLAQEVVLHEIGHNWDESDTNASIATFRAISGWGDSDLADVPGYVLSGDGEWAHLASADFTRNYGKENPYEDFAESFAAFWLHKLDLLSTLAEKNFDDLPEKMAYMQDFVDNVI